MAARTPTAFSTTEPVFRPREEILSSYADDLFDDQQLVLDKNEMVISDQFARIYDTTVASWVEYRRYFTRAPNMCGTSATINAQASFLCWSNDATDFDIAIYHNGRAVRHSSTISANHTTAIWRPWFSVVLYGDGTENELLIQMNNNNSPSTPHLYLAGVALFTNY